MNKDLIKIEVDKKVIDMAIYDRDTTSKVSLSLLGENDTEVHTLVFSSHHDQDCCESVYADFTVLKYQKEELQTLMNTRNLENILLKSVEDMGFLMCFVFGKEEWNKHSVKVFIPCYNWQNGYYSDELALIIENDGVKTKIDISDFVEDHIG